MNYILETERLRLRELTLDDALFIIELLNSPGWLKYIGDRNVKTEEKAISYLQNGPLKSYKENGYGLSLVEIKDNRQAIGMCEIIKRETLQSPDIGFAFLPGHIGKGYALEIAGATLAFAQKELNLQEILAITLPENKKSIRLLEKIGLKYSETICLPGDEEELLLYKI